MRRLLGLFSHYYKEVKMTHPNCDKLVKALADMLNAIRTCNIDSPEIGDASTGNHKWHEEWAHLAEQALASHQSAPSTPTDEKRAALDAFQFLVNNARPRVEINQKHIDTIKAALTTPPDNVGDEVVEALEDILTVIKEGHMQTFKITNSATGETWNWHDEWAKMATEALIKKNGGG